MSQKSRAVFLYRGQLDNEWSRISFLLDCTVSAFDHVDIIHLSPGRGAGETEWRSFQVRYPQIESVQIVQAGLARLRSVRATLREGIPESAVRVVVGFSAGAFMPSDRCEVWFINGIPEERLLSQSGLRARITVAGAWALARRVRAGRHVVVSEPMARLVRSRLRVHNLSVVPNTVDPDVFHVDPSAARTHLTYQGGGSPWQGLERLNMVWQELHLLDPSLRFRAITRDERAKVLLQGLPAHVVDVVSSTDPAQVADWLSAARLGFLYRAPNLVNRVSWPMKLGEYLAAGVPTVVSRCGWDIERVVADHGAGIVVDWDDSPAATARAIVEYLRRSDDGRAEGVARAADYLSSPRWKEGLVSELIAAGGAR